MNKKRKKDSHKGENGIVLIIGGSERYSGAPYLATRAVAALRTGPDLVFLACPHQVAWAINSMNPDLITEKLRGKYLKKRHFRKLVKMSEKADVILLGPGIGQHKKTKKLLEKFLPVVKDKKKVVDADALKTVKIQELENTVFTPHQKEWHVLLENSGLSEKNYRSKLKSNVLLLKGKQDKIISKDKKKTNKTGNEGMTVGGTGDILAGLTAGFIAQGMSLFKAAERAAKLNGKLGDKLKEELGYGMIASDFLKEIAVVNKKMK